MSDEPSGRPRTSEKTNTAQFHYLKSNYYRVICAEGAIGSLTPHGKIFFSLYNERVAIPRSVTHELSPEGELGDSIDKDQRDGIVRELEVGVMLDRETAEGLRVWLAMRIAEFDEISKQIPRQKATEKGEQ